MIYTIKIHTHCWGKAKVGMGFFRPRLRQKPTQKIRKKRKWVEAVTIHPVGLLVSALDPKWAVRGGAIVIGLDQ